MANQVPAKISLSTVFARECHTSFHTGDAGRDLFSLLCILRFPRGRAPEHVPHVTQVLTFVFVVVRDVFDLRAKSRLGDREALGELASSWLPLFLLRDVPRDRRGRRRGRLRSLPLSCATVYPSVRIFYVRICENVHRPPPADYL